MALLRGGCCGGVPGSRFNSYKATVAADPQGRVPAVRVDETIEALNMTDAAESALRVAAAAGGGCTPVDYDLRWIALDEPAQVALPLTNGMTLLVKLLARGEHNRAARSRSAHG